MCYFIHGWQDLQSLQPTPNDRFLRNFSRLFYYLFYSYSSWEQTAERKSYFICFRDIWAGVWTTVFVYNKTTYKILYYADFKPQPLLSHRSLLFIKTMPHLDHFFFFFFCCKIKFCLRNAFFPYTITYILKPCSYFKSFVTTSLTIIYFFFFFWIIFSRLVEKTFLETSNNFVIL